jgi:ubiquinone/menaquinone biosynthesis C-methylase UbiE
MDSLYEMFDGMPRGGPGSNAATRQAYALVPGLPPAPEIIDIGCGPGMQTLELARLSVGHVTALDNHPPFLEQLERNAAAAGLAGAVTTLEGDMAALLFPALSFDLIWAEGSIFIMGFEAGLRYWQRFLRPGGCIAVTEISWLKDDPPQAPHDFFAAEYPAMRSVTQNLEIIRQTGLRLVSHFTLPEAAWWDDYYTPLAARLPRLKEAHPDDFNAQALIAATEVEIETYRKYSAWYGSEFYIMQLGA